MPKARRANRKQDPVEQNRNAIMRAREMVARTPLSEMMRLAKVEVTSDFANSVDAVTGQIYLNPYTKSQSVEYWSGVIGHMLLHLGLNHAARREERDPLLWNSVCERKVDLLLPLFGLKPPDGAGAREDDEQEEISYDNLVRDLEQRKRLGKSGGDAFNFRFGSGRDPLLWNYAADFVINGWLVEMGVGRVPSIGMLFDPRLKGMSAEEVYDLLIQDPRRCKGLRGFRGKLGDIVHEGPDRRVFRGDVTTLDDIYRRCVEAGMACPTRGLLPAGLLEEIKSLFTPPVPWDVELARWMEANVPIVREPLRTYARASRRQASTPDIPRPARYVPQEWKDACTFGVILDTSGSMDREVLGRALGAIASYAEARDVTGIRLVLCMLFLSAKVVALVSFFGYNTCYA